MLLEDFVTYSDPREPFSHEAPTIASYAAYGPQRVLGSARRHDARLGALPLRPSPMTPTKQLASDWTGGTVMLNAGEWRYQGDPVTLTIVEIGGADGNAYLITKPSIPTDDAPGGKSFWNMQEVASQGTWKRPGTITKIRVGLGVKPWLFAGALAIAAFALLRDASKMFRSNPARSERQRRLFGTALAVKRGRRSPRSVTGAARRLARTLPERTLKKYAKK